MQIKKIFTLTILLYIVSSFCYSQNNPIELVDPFIGTDYHGHTYPGVSVPFGMVQLSPDTRQTGWDACSGYHYSDNSIAGFSHTHLSGTGIGDYGDIMLMPTVDNNQKTKGDKDNPDSGFRSRFSKDNENASPGYYSVLLEDYNILVELTATNRTGLHRYTFPKSKNARIILDLSHVARVDGHKNTDLSLEVINNTTIQGMKKTSGWAAEQFVYFYAEFSKPFNKYSINDKENRSFVKGKDIKGYFNFTTTKDEEILVKVGISSVSIEGAKANLEAESPSWNFSEIKEKAEKLWNDQLNKITVEGSSKSNQTIFYTAMYHAFLTPNTYMDVDGKFRGMDRKIHESNDFTNYTVFSLWDTYRTLHPLFTIIEQERTNDFIKALLNAYEVGGSLPMWALAGNYTGTMIGYHAVSVIIDAYMKGINDYDIEKAYEAIIHSSNYNRKGIKAKRKKALEHLMPKAKLYNSKLGFIPADLENESVSKALEFAYNDWCIAQLAKALGKTEDYKTYTERSQRYKKYFDESVGFMRGINKDGTWVNDFNPKFSRHRRDQYTEGNAWQWTWYVPHDVPGLVSLFEGKKNFVTKLDSLFSIDSKIEGEHASGDISGLIGQYAHGNEPSQQIAYLYNYVGQHWKTQALTDSILTTLYTDQPDGLSGNEDCGQMSAWYIMSSMGFYPVCPGETRYTIGRPLFDKTTINLENGKKFIIESKNNSTMNKFIQSVKLNGKDLKEPFIDHKSIVNGGVLSFEMGKLPNYRLYKSD